MVLGCEAWLMLIQPAIHMVAMDANMFAVGDVASDTSPDAVRWNFIVAKYFNVFKPPGMPAEGDTVHQTKLKPGSVPPYKRQYRVSAADLPEVR